MPQEASATLREALDQMERIRKRGLLIERIVLYPSVLFFVWSVLFLLFHPNKWLGLTIGIVSLFGIIGAVGLDVQRSVNSATQRILKAIEISSRGEPRA
jgi:hypothetical protein